MKRQTSQFPRFPLLDPTMIGTCSVFNSVLAMCIASNSSASPMGVPLPCNLNKIEFDSMKWGSWRTTHSAYTSLEGESPESFQARVITSACPRGPGTVQPAFSVAPSDPIATPEMTEYILSPSRMASSNLRNISAQTASPGRVPSARWSNGLQWPDGEKS